MAPPEKRHSDRMRDQKKEIELDVHMVSMENLFERFDSSLQGLTASQAEKNLEKYGPNTLTPPPKTPEWIKFVKQLFGGFSTLLWCGAILCFIAYVLQYETEDYPELDNVWLGVVLSNAQVPKIFGKSSFTFPLAGLRKEFLSSSLE